MSCSTQEERRSALVPSRSIDKAARFDLVDVRSAVPGIAVDLRYGTRQNVTKSRLYPSHMPCLLRRSTALKLKAAHDILSAQGFGIRVWDAYRPPEVQRMLHDHGHRTGMFLSPEIGWSRHCAGIAVDATMVNRWGQEVRMPSYFDEGLERASTSYKGSDPQVRRNLETFHKAMRQAGFVPLEAEWWHFDDDD
ncbi:MAG: M15 family metallopeptidase, partial [Verrucomicrobiaceae bacterium]|nr:M15 family metallopeptidase [Verrucomicrobiaceae bacterium]